MIRRLLTLLTLLLATGAQAGPIKRIAQPAISPDGSTIAFSWQGDIWVVPSQGGKAERLTIHPANDTSPHWTPDGKPIVFASDRYGFPNVFSMASDGSDLKRLTFEGAATIPYSVSPDGKYVYGYSAAFTGTRSNLFRVPLGGGDLIRLTDHPFEGVAQPVVTPNGKQVLFIRGSYGTFAWEKPSVHSSAMPNFFLADNSVPLTHQHPIGRSEATQMFPSLDRSGHVYYVSNESGWPNLWRMTLEGSDRKVLTHHLNGTMRYSTVSTTGRYAAYVFESELYLLDTQTGQEKKVEVQVPADARSNPVQEINLTQGADEFAVSPDSKRAVIGARGDLFLLPEKGGTTRRLTTNTAWGGHPVFLDSKRVLYVSSDGGKRSLRQITLDGTATLFAQDDEDLFNPLLSPDGKWVAYLKGEEEIMAMPATGGKPVSLLKGNFRDAVDTVNMAWSPDSKWLLVDRPTNLTSSQVVAAQVLGDKRIVVARTAHGATNLGWMQSGKSIYFIASEYAEKPDLFSVDLTPPDANFAEDDLDKLDEPKPAGKTEPSVEIQEAGIELRLKRLTTSGDVSAVAASSDGKAYYVGGPSGISALPAANGPAKPIDGAPANPSVLQLGPGGQKLYVLASGKLYTIPLDKPGSPTAIGFNATYTVNLREEESALFDEIWWTMDRFYYDPKFHGVDWKAIKKKFAAIVPYTYDRTDFYDLMEEMMEEINSSHLGVQAPAQAPFGNEQAGYIGVWLDPVALDARQSYIVQKVDPNSPADNPQSKLLTGDKILSVDGQSPSATSPQSSLLSKKAGKKVALRIERDGKEKSLVIKPSTTASQRQLNYENWVAWERAETERLSGGKLTYLHVRAMDDASYERFLREIRTYAVGKQGVIIDVRYNGGGSTSHKFLGVLIKTPWLVRTTRGYEGLKLSENIYRGDSLELPTALLFNTYSFSNAEIMGEGFRRLKRGSIIGERTPGYVIGTGFVRLWDGGGIRLPEIGSYQIDGVDMENNGRKPDFQVWFDPDAWSAGRDLQLEKSVEVLLKQIGG